MKKASRVDYQIFYGKFALMEAILLIFHHKVWNWLIIFRVKFRNLIEIWFINLELWFLIAHRIQIWAEWKMACLSMLCLSVKCDQPLYGIISPRFWNRLRFTANIGNSGDLENLSVECFNIWTNIVLKNPGKFSKVNKIVWNFPLRITFIFFRFQMIESKQNLYILIVKFKNN